MSSRKLAAVVTTAALAIGAAVATVPAVAAHAARTASNAKAAPYLGPQLKLITAQNHITVVGFPVRRGSKKVLVFIDPGI